MNNNKKIQKLTLTSLMIALCYVCFTFLQIKLATPAGYTSFHMGNVMCVLAALLLDGVTGGIAGAIGMGIGDLFDPVYITTAPKTLFLKFMMGLICGLVAHKVFHINQKKGKDIFVCALLSISIAMLFNIVAEPSISYLYYRFILGNETKAAGYLAVGKWISVSVNAVLSIVIGTPLYTLIRARMKKFFDFDK